MFQCPTCHGLIFLITGTRTVAFTKEIDCTSPDTPPYEIGNNYDDEILDEDWDEMRCTACKKTVLYADAKAAFQAARQDSLDEQPDPNQLPLL